MEHFDLLNCRGEKTGELIPRDEAHRTGAWHGAFHCLIVGERQGKGFVLFQKRSLEKKIAPGYYDVSVGGHYSAGEDAAIAGPREIKEELGLEVTFNELLPAGRRVFVYCFENVRECEFQDLFLLPRPVFLKDLTLQREEVDGVIELDVEQGIALLTGRMPFVESTLIQSNGESRAVRVAADEFVPCLDQYYLKLFLVARRYTRGERSPLLI